MLKLLASLTTKLLRLIFFNDTATTEIYTLSLHDALPIYVKTLARVPVGGGHRKLGRAVTKNRPGLGYSHVHTAIDADRKSTRLNSSHANISYAVFCLKKKNISKLQNADEIVYNYSLT